MEAVEAAFTKPPEVKRTQALLSEFIGTFFLLFVIQTTRTGSVLDGYVGVGVTVGGMIYAFDHVSGAHFNPAVTLGVVLNGRMGIGTALLYVAAQLLGAFAGALASLATLWGLAPGVAVQQVQRQIVHEQAPVPRLRQEPRRARGLVR
jgi:glycerol uptake facilitator-like aquaporin